MTRILGWKSGCAFGDCEADVKYHIYVTFNGSMSKNDDEFDFCRRHEHFFDICSMKHFLDYYKDHFFTGMLINVREFGDKMFTPNEIIQKIKDDGI